MKIVVQSGHEHSCRSYGISGEVNQSALRVCESNGMLAVLASALQVSTKSVHS